MTGTTDTATPITAGDERRIAGTVGIAVAIAVAVILGIHPPGTTSLYNDGPEFVEHVSWFWVIIHVLGAIALFGVPVVVSAWSGLAATAGGRLFTRLAAGLSVAGVALAALHLVGTDTVTFLAYEPTLEQGGDAVTIGADVLLRIHAATLMAFGVTLLLGVSLALAVGAWLDANRGWRFWVPAAVVVCQSAAVVITLAERQWTTLSEMVFFRSAVTLFLVWLFLAGRDLRRSAPAS